MNLNIQVRVMSVYISSGTCSLKIIHKLLLYYYTLISKPYVVVKSKCTIMISKPYILFSGAYLKKQYLV